MPYSARLFYLMCLALVAMPFPAQAANPGDACTAGENGYVQTNGGTMIVCNGTVWTAAIILSSTAGRMLMQVDYDAGVCTTTKAGRLRYNSAGSPAWQYCDGSTWTTWQRSGGGTGYLVQTQTKWNGNLGGLSGANAKCLTELQTTYNWNGKANAGTLNSTRVYAFLCDGATCNNLKTNTPYLLAKANNTTACGWGFITNATGLGPNLTGEYWDQNDVCYTGTGQAPGEYTWTNRGTSGANWATTPKGTAHCTNWTIGTSAKTGSVGNASNDDSLIWDNGVDNCNATHYLMCAVDP
jgi:hypothetical protein